MSFHNPYIPYGADALASAGMSEKTVLALHADIQTAYGKQILGFYDWFEQIRLMSPEDVVADLSKRQVAPNVQHAFCQFTNINFSWLSMSVEGGKPVGRIAELLTRSFGSIASFKREFRGAAARAITPDWIWLLRKSNGAIKVEMSDHLTTPLADSQQLPLLCCSLAEHAYLFDYGCDRDAYIVNWLDRLANFGFADARLG